MSSLFGSGVEKWAELAAALQLAPFEPTIAFAHGTSFRQMKRALGVPARGEPKFSHWLYGARDGVELIVLTFDVGSGSSQTTHTGVVARIDPPLLLGFGARTHYALDGLFGTEDVKLGYPAIDARIHLTAFDPSRAIAMLSPRDPAGWALLQRTLRAMSLDVSVSDSVVMVHRSGTLTEPGPVEALVEEATTLAREYATRRRALPDTPAEEQIRREWRAFADAHALAFDAPRMKLDGTMEGSAIEMAIETEGQLARTTVTVRFPASVPVAFTARRTSVPGFLQGLFQRDIKVGQPRFDEMFAVTGYPEERVRELLAKPELLNVLMDIGARTTEVQLNHAQLHFSLPGATTTAAQLHELANVARVATAFLFGSVAGLAPYR